MTLVISEDDVWIGANVVLVDGTILRKGSVGSALVRAEMPPYAIVGGVPARIIGYRQ